MGATTQPDNEDKSTLEQLCGQGWQPLDPTTDKQEAMDQRIIGNYKGEPITVGFKIDEVSYEEGENLHEIFRTGRYDVHLKIESLGANMAEGMIKVETAPGYNQQS